MKLRPPTKGEEMQSVPVDKPGYPPRNRSPNGINSPKHGDVKVGLRPARPVPPRLSPLPKHNQEHLLNGPASPYRRQPMSPSPTAAALSSHPPSGLRSRSNSRGMGSAPNSPTVSRPPPTPTSPNPLNTPNLRHKPSKGLRPRGGPPLPSPLNEGAFPRAGRNASPTYATSPGFRRPTTPASSTASPRTTYLSSYSAVSQDSSEAGSRRPSTETTGRSRGLTVSSNKSAPPRQFSRTTTGLADNVATRGTTYTLDSFKSYYDDDDKDRFSLSQEPMPPGARVDGNHSSFQSQLTNASNNSFLYASSTERSSIVTKASSVSDMDGVTVYGTEGSTTISGTTVNTENSVPSEYDGETDVDELDDIIALYGERRSLDRPRTSDDDAPPVPPLPLDIPPRSAPPNVQAHSETDNPQATLFPPPNFSVTSTVRSDDAPVPRDHYGFKKANGNDFTESDYDAWWAGYSQYVDRRREKWHVMLKQYGFPIENPDKFPTKSESMKYMVRKGIPPEYRGAAWFWYAGGHELLERDQGVYEQLLMAVDKGKLSEMDRDGIERDLHRTFPDNIKFKPEKPRPTSSSTAEQSITDSGEPVREETPIIKSLRRVLQAFAVRNHNIGYCQSLNFLAGMLLLVLDDEEKAFILLNILTKLHLPGNHTRTLGTDVDNAVLMTYLKETMPGVFNKIDDYKWIDVPDRLPTISLVTTSWFMSAFVTTLPTETVLRVWDSFFYEGAKMMFRVALAIFKNSEPELRSIKDTGDSIFAMQGLPRRLLDPNPLLEICFNPRHRGGFGGISADKVERLRRAKRLLLAEHQQATAVKDSSVPLPGDLDRATTSLSTRSGTKKNRFKRMGTKKKKVEE